MSWGAVVMIWFLWNVVCPIVTIFLFGLALWSPLLYLAWRDNRRERRARKRGAETLS